MSTLMANAYPKKTFFVQMFTKDLSLEDCILDLVDNAIDGLIRAKKFALSNISQSIFSKQHLSSKEKLPTVDIAFDETSFSIKDGCGGIDIKDAEEEVFNFGHSANYKKTNGLGVYGIGLKRALFKMGNLIRIESKTAKNGFVCNLDVREWVSRDEDLNDWRIPLETSSAASSDSARGTKIHVEQLHKTVSARFQDETFESALCKEIASTYAFFLGKYVQIRVNKNTIKPPLLPLGKPKGGSMAYESIEKDQVKIKIYATVALPDDNKHFASEKAGWYIVCNGRVVLIADKGPTSGWGTSPMPQFQPKHRPFVGFVFFEAPAEALPWTTTKRGLNKESEIYQYTRNRMAVVARPIISYCDKQYSAVRQEEEKQEEYISKNVVSASFSEASHKPMAFIPPANSKPKTTIRIQYDVNSSEIDKIRRHTRNYMSYVAIGRLTFDYYMKQEGLK